MDINWTKHISDQNDKVQYEKSLRSSRWILDRQSEILQVVERDLNKQEASPSAYDKPNWDYRQAHANGFRQCLQLVLRLNNLDPKEITNDQRDLISDRTRPSDV